MGGLSGHMMHPYDDLSLTKEQFKNIFNTAIEEGGVLKTDGFNMHFIIYNDELRMVRNASELPFGFIDIDNRFKNNKKAVCVYNIAYNIFNEFIKQCQWLPENDGNRGLYTINVECLKEGVTNIIEYPYNAVIIHNIYKYEYIDGKYIHTATIPVPEMDVFRCEHGLVFTDPHIKPNKIYYNESLIDDVFEDCNTVEELYRKNFNNLVFGLKNDDIKNGLFDRLFGLRKVYISELKKKASDPMELDIIKGVEYNSKDIMNNIINSLRYVTFRIGFNILSNIDADNIEQKFITSNIFTLSRTSYDSYIKNVFKLGGIPLTPLPIEGIVLNLYNKQYKITGNFSIINSIVGQSLYGKS